MKNIVILGSTGSIGRSALEVVDRFPELLRVVGLAAGRNSNLLQEQIIQYQPQAVALGEEEPSAALKETCLTNNCRLLHGADPICAMASGPDSEAVVAAMIGGAGLLPTLEAIRAGKRIALANKEVLVMAGELVMNESRKSGAEILPIDSEHNAIFQCLQGQPRESLRRILLCSSGGPFLNSDIDDLHNVSVDEALKHPCWQMGRKITIDSATMMNKGLEMIEARWLFDLHPDQIEVVIHPQAIVHSLVEFEDGSLLAQLSNPDMRMPIQYCLSYPERWSQGPERLDLTAVPPLQFIEPDRKKFPALILAGEALRKEGTMTTVLNAADEIAVGAFLEQRISFPAIMQVVSEVMDQHILVDSTSLDNVIKADRWAREVAKTEIEKM